MKPKIAPVRIASENLGRVRLAPLLTAAANASVDIAKAITRVDNQVMMGGWLRPGRREESFRARPTRERTLGLAMPFGRQRHGHVWPRMLTRASRPGREQATPQEVGVFYPLNGICATAFLRYRSACPQRRMTGVFIPINRELSHSLVQERRKWTDRTMRPAPCSTRRTHCKY